MAQAFVSERVVTAEGVRRAALLVEDGVIRAVCAPEELPAGVPATDFGRRAILPGLVDSHVHINEPGRTEWEGFATATRAAAAGGYTLLVDMPLNCLPETTTVEALEAKREAAQGKTLVDWAAWGGAVADNQADILPLARAGVPGYKCFLIYPGCDGFTMIDREQLERALPAIAAGGRPLLVHAELAEPIDRAIAQLNAECADWRRYATYLASRPDEAELEAIRMMIGLCRRYGFRLHIVHLATAEAVEELRAAKAEGLPITVETCPHYLYFAAEEIADGATTLKCAPPIRGRENREALWRALGEGVIDMVVTDHSPCPPEMKREADGRFDTAWGGIASLSVALPAVWTGAAVRGFGLEEVAWWMSTAPARLAGLGEIAGALTAGREASFVVFDPEAEQEVRAEDLHTRHAISPYVGQRLRGRVEATYLRGEAVFRREGDAKFAEAVRGREWTHEGLNETLAAWNGMTAEAAAEAVLPCCGSRVWAAGLAARRPFARPAELFAASDEVWLGLGEQEWQEAFDSHPRIGQRHAQAATARSLSWSEGEQSAAMASQDDAAKAALAEGNREYEARFGRIFLVCASGKSTEEILAILRARMGNTAEAELREAVEQQRQITRLRLGRWLDIPT
ncbi:MAG TPA: allantoinase AllB [Acidobacteriaceae bacterium]|nr:allantoinase AllB [Acidobacteriaceae bacterium]